MRENDIRRKIDGKMDENVEKLIRQQEIRNYNI